MDELLCVIELLIVIGPRHIINKGFKVQQSPLLPEKLTNLITSCGIDVVGSFYFTKKIGIEDRNIHLMGC